MPSHATITVLGYLGKDPVFDDKNEAARFSLAHTRKRKDKETTTWYQVTAWRGTAKVAAQYLKKGSPVLVTGEPYQDNYIDKDGKPATAMKIEVTSLTLLGPKESTAADAARPAPAERILPTGLRSPAPTTDDEPPF